jgi:anti-sigma regulatory factor (Ser/Thr protein kinase)
MHANPVTIHFAGTHDGFAQGFARLRGVLDAERLDSASRFSAELIFEEVIANIIRHGAPDGRQLDVRVTLEARADSIVLTFDDDGVQFDPRGHPDPVPANSLDEAKVGGLGLMLVRRAASALDYRRTAEGRNRLTVTVQRPREAAAPSRAPCKT